MKKKTLIMAFVIILSQVSVAIEIKAIIGMNSSQYICTSEIAALDLKAKTGLSFGLGVMYPLNQKMELELNAMFRQGGARASVTYAPNQLVPAIYKNNSLVFPVFFKYRLKSEGSPYIALGPEFIFLLSHRLFFTEDEEDFDLKKNSKKFILAYTAMIGYELPLGGDWALCAEIRYARWLSNFLVDPATGVKSNSFVFMLGGVYYL